MLYQLKNGQCVLIRPLQTEDAEAMIHLIRTADCETPFLARNPGEFNVTVENEKKIIANALSNHDAALFAAEYHGQIVGHCSVALVRSRQRFRHRAEVAFVLLKDYWNLGIGGKMMQTCLDWCRDHSVNQIELTVVTQNERALNMYKSFGFGFEICGTVPHALCYPDGSFADEYMMIKQL